MADKEDFYKKLRITLDETTQFPSKYLYKFIIPNDDLKLNIIKDVFNYGGAVIDTKFSKTGKFISVSILIEMQSSDEIISKYHEVGHIKGLISL
jgi:putative lipoic acid-binding regulatory protein